MPITNDGYMVYIKGRIYVREHSETGRFHVFDKEGIADDEPLEHDHGESFDTLDEAIQYIKWRT